MGLRTDVDEVENLEAGFPVSISAVYVVCYHGSCNAESAKLVSMQMSARCSCCIGAHDSYLPSSVILSYDRSGC